MTVMEVEMKKKIIVILLCLLFSLSLIFTLSSCDNELPKDSSNTQSSNADDSSTSDDASTEQPPITDDTEGENSSDVNNENGDVPPTDSDGENNDGATDNTPDDSQESSVEFSKGLEYSLSNDSTYYILTGIGSCTDSEIVIPPTYQSLPIKEIASYAFRDQKITSLTTSNNLTTIGRYAFDGCTELKEITLSKDVFSIAFYAFSDCEKLDTIVVDTANPYYTVEDNVLFTKQGADIEGTKLTEKILVVYPLGSLKTSYTIPDDVVYIAPCAFLSCNNLKNIEISEGVSTIGNAAFSYCKNLESIVIPDSVISIESEAFSGCGSLWDITIGSAVTSIGKNAFSGTAYYYDALNWRKGLLYIGNYLISANSGQLSAEISVKDGTLVISDYAFINCKAMTSIDLPDSLKYIGVGAFDGCDELKTVTIPDSVIEIGDEAFRSCDSLLSITFGESIQRVGVDIFDFCNKLIEICNKSNFDMTKLPESLWLGGTSYMDVSNIHITDGDSKLEANRDGYWLYTSADGTLLLDYTGNDTEITIPSSVAEIAKSAFADNTSITTIHIPSSVKAIESYAFSGCTKLKTLTIPETIDYIGYKAFSDCSELADISIEGDFSVDGNPFYGTAYYLNSENWENGLFYIGTILVEYDKSQTSVAIKEGTTEILYGVFSGCENLVSVTIPNSVTKIGNSAFSGCEGLRTVVLPSALQSIGSSAFKNCENITSITIPDSVVTIESYAFKDCDRLSSVTLGKGVRYIGYDAFDVWGGYSLTRVYIDDIESWCKIKFENAKANPCNQGYCTLYIDGEWESTIEIPEGTEKINSYAFYGVKCTKYKLPDSITEIGEGAFAGYSGRSVYFDGDIAEWCLIDFENGTANPLCNGGWLHINNRSNPVFELTIPATVQQIKDYAFYGARGISTLMFENGSVCSSIGNYAFWNVSSLQGMRFAPSVKTIGEHAFDNCQSLQFANINMGVSTIDEYAFNNCNKLTEILCGKALRNINENVFYNCSALEIIYYYGEKSSWEKADIDSSNAEIMFTPVFFYSEEKPTDKGNYWHYVDNSIAFWGTVDPGEIPPYVGYQTELYAEWFETIFQSSGTYSDMLYADCVKDQKYLDAINNWELLHMATEPSHTLESGKISQKDIYKLIIYDMLGGSSSYEDLANLYDTVNNDTTNYMYKFVKRLGSAAIIELEDMADYNTSDYTSELKEIFGNIDKLDDILKHFDCLYDAVYTCAQYQAFANMDEAFKNVLTEIYNDTENPDDLRNAAYESIACYEAGVQNILAKIVESTMKNEFKMLMGDMMDEAWKRVVYSIPGGVGVIVMEGAKGIRALGNTFFNLDDRNDAFYQLEANVLLERAILRVLPGLYNDYTKTFAEYEAATYMRAIDMYKCVAISGFDYCIQLLEIKASAVGTSKEDKADCNSLIEEIEALKQTKGIEFKRFEQLTWQHYQKLYSTVNE